MGQYGRRFKMFKLRTMVKNAHELRDQLMHLNEVDGPVFKIRKDPRLHPLGGFLRRTSLRPGDDHAESGYAPPHRIRQCRRPFPGCSTQLA